MAAICAIINIDQYSRTWQQGTATRKEYLNMLPSETICISLGNWVIAFYAVYAMAGIALLSASAVLIDWAVGMVRSSRGISNVKFSRRAQVLGSQA
jgi:hypothetical protein